jgi:hypothetical protein
VQLGGQDARARVELLQCRAPIPELGEQTHDGDVRRFRERIDRDAFAGEAKRSRGFAPEPIDERAEHV